MNICGYPVTRNFLNKIGPAWIVMIADVDVGSIITGLETGSLYGYHAIFILLILALPLAVIQYASGKIGLVTGKGLGELMRENYSLKISAMASVPMAATDFLSYVAEYAGIAIGFEILGISPFVSLPLIYVFHNLVVLTRNYDNVEKVLVPMSVVLIIAIFSAVFIFKPPVMGVFSGFSPIQPYGNRTFDYYVVANIGAVVMPFMLFYQTGATAEKKLGTGDMKLMRNETAFGAIVSEVLMVFLVIAGTFIGGNLGINYIMRVTRQFGPLAPYVLAVGLITAGFLALVVISLASSWGIAEVFAWMSHSVDGPKQRWKFYILYVAESFPAMLLAMWFAFDLIGLVINLMVVFVIVLIPVGLLVGLLVRNGKIMGSHASRSRYMKLYWIVFLLVEVAGLSGIALSL